MYYEWWTRWAESQKSGNQKSVCWELGQIGGQNNRRMGYLAHCSLLRSLKRDWMKTQWSAFYHHHSCGGKIVIMISDRGTTVGSLIIIAAPGKTPAWYILCLPFPCAFLSASPIFLLSSLSQLFTGSWNQLYCTAPVQRDEMAHPALPTLRRMNEGEGPDQTN